MQALERVPEGRGTAVQATDIPAGFLQKLLQRSPRCWRWESRWLKRWGVFSRVPESPPPFSLRDAPQTHWWGLYWWYCSPPPGVSGRQNKAALWVKKYWTLGCSRLKQLPIGDFTISWKNKRQRPLGIPKNEQTEQEKEWLAHAPRALPNTHTHTVTVSPRKKPERPVFCDATVATNNLSATVPGSSRLKQKQSPLSPISDNLKLTWTDHHKQPSKVPSMQPPQNFWPNSGGIPQDGQYYICATKRILTKQNV